MRPNRQRRAEDRLYLAIWHSIRRSLDEVFGALSDPTRRVVIGELGTRARERRRAGAVVADDAAVVHEARPHLERCGLIRTAKSGRVRTCTLDRERLAVVDGWLAEQRAIWEGRTDRLEQFVTNPRGAVVNLDLDLDLDLSLDRVIRAPRSVVWEAWTDPREPRLVVAAGADAVSGRTARRPSRAARSSPR